MLLEAHLESTDDLLIFKGMPFAPVKKGNENFEFNN
jgi:hypothetical protein